MNERSPTGVHAARNTWVVARPLLSWVLATAVLCALLVLVGAVNSYGLPLGARFLFWGGLFAVAVCFAIGIEAVLIRSGLALEPAWRWISVFSLILAAAMTPVAYVANSLGGWAPLSMLLPHFGNSIVISLAFVGLRVGLGKILADCATAEAEARDAPVLMQRMSPGLRDAELRAIEAEGHYVRIHTDLGSELVLMRLKDAIGEVGDVDGLQVHRGWWVARGAVMGSNTKGDRLELELDGELSAPVSRSRRADLKARGWI